MRGGNLEMREGGMLFGVRARGVGEVGCVQSDLRPRSHVRATHLRLSLR